jgi:hypothetical protein
MFLLPLLVMASTSHAFSSKKADESVWVSRADGSKQCDRSSGQAIDAGADELRKAGIDVLESRKGRDGKMHSQMCGAATGATNEYRVARDKTQDALSLGYNPKS